MGAMRIYEKPPDRDGVYIACRAKATSLGWIDRGKAIPLLVVPEYEADELAFWTLAELEAELARCEAELARRQTTTPRRDPA